MSPSSTKLRLHNLNQETTASDFMSTYMITGDVLMSTVANKAALFLACKSKLIRNLKHEHIESGANSQKTMHTSHSNLDDRYDC